MAKNKSKQRAAQNSAGARRSTSRGEEKNSGAKTLGVAAELKKRLEETRLPAAVKREILANMPSLKEQERLYRELQDKGGLSFEQLLASLGLETESHP